MKKIEENNFNKNIKDLVKNSLENNKVENYELISEVYEKSYFSLFTGHNPNNIDNDSRPFVYNTTDIEFLYIRNFIDEDVIKEVVKKYPKSEELLLNARKSLILSGCDNILIKEYNEQKYIEYIKNKIEKYSLGNNNSNKKYKQVYKGYIRDTEYLKSVDGEETRDWRHHIIDDASAIMSFANAIPYLSGILPHFNNNYLFVLERVENGIPIFKNTNRQFSNLMDTKYWNLYNIKKILKRNFAIVNTVKDACLVLFDMYLQGYEKAFVKSLSSKTGTWIIDLREIKTINDCYVEYAKVINYKIGENIELMIQEHVPFIFEQRFFVHNGNIAASVCSHRDSNVLDSCEDILDKRVARICKTSKNEIGAYDRGKTEAVLDEQMSAEFYKEAKKIVDSLPKDNYVVDIGMTEKGIMPVEFNSFILSGPYSLQHRKLINAFNVFNKDKINELKKVLHINKKNILDEDLAKIIYLLNPIKKKDIIYNFIKDYIKINSFNINEIEKLILVYSKLIENDGNENFNILSKKGDLLSNANFIIYYLNNNFDSKFKNIKNVEKKEKREAIEIEYVCLLIVKFLVYFKEKIMNIDYLGKGSIYEIINILDKMIKEVEFLNENSIFINKECILILENMKVLKNRININNSTFKYHIDKKKYISNKVEELYLNLEEVIVNFKERIKGRLFYIMYEEDIFKMNTKFGIYINSKYQCNIKNIQSKKEDIFSLDFIRNEDGVFIDIYYNSKNMRSKFMTLKRKNKIPKENKKEDTKCR